MLFRSVAIEKEEPFFNFLPDQMILNKSPILTGSIVFIACPTDIAFKRLLIEGFSYTDIKIFPHRKTLNICPATIQVTAAINDIPIFIVIFRIP